jgi:hypothetical protein
MQPWAKGLKSEGHKATEGRRPWLGLKIAVGPKSRLLAPKVFYLKQD